MTLPDFIARCEAYRAEAGKSLAWVSKKLFNDHDRLALIASGESDVGVKRLAEAVALLAKMDRELKASRQDIAA